MVLGLVPDAAARLVELIRAAFVVTDADLLGPCWAHVARMLMCRGEHESDPRWAAAEPDALAFVEQFVIDANGVRGHARVELEKRLGKAGTFNFVAALNVVEGYLRTCALLALDPGPMPPPTSPGPGVPAPERGRRARRRDQSTSDEWTTNVDVRLRRTRATFARAVFRLNGVDDVTTELIRLRNASIQGCHY